MVDIKRLRELYKSPMAHRRPWHVIPGPEDGIKCRIANDISTRWDESHPIAFMNRDDALLTVEAVNALPEALDEIERLRSGIDGALSTLSLAQEPSCDQSAWLELAIEKLEKARGGNSETQS